MKVSGFTILRNGVEFAYPFEESILSLLPFVDELVVNVGRGTDETLKHIQNLARLHSKIKIFETEWPLHDEEKKRGGFILSEQTNLALQACQNDWCFYLQADEVLHEKDYAVIWKSLEVAEKNPKIEGLVFSYHHFYGDYSVVQFSHSAYRRELRAIRKSADILSVGDAQSFRKITGEKVSALLCPAHIYHYGWVRPPEAMKEKTFFMDQLYHGKPNKEQEAQRIPFSGNNYQYKKFWGLRPFQGSHPAIMRGRISRQGQRWDLDRAPRSWSLSDIKKISLDMIEKFTGHRLFEYRNYYLVRPRSERVERL